MHTVLLLLLLTTKPASIKERHGNSVRWNVRPAAFTYMKRLSFLTVGPSRAGSSEILMASSMAARRPFPPSPLRAGPKHSGRRISKRTTTLAFSSTLSPVRGNRAHAGQNFKNIPYINHHMKVRTVNKDSKAEEIQVSLSSAWIPADVRVALRKEHRTHLQPTTGQIRHHLSEHMRQGDLKSSL